jgi:hypothetical protein
VDKIIYRPGNRREELVWVGYNEKTLVGDTERSSGSLHCQAIVLSDSSNEIVLG